MNTTFFKEGKDSFQLQMVLLSALPVAAVWTMSWFGVFTFVNAYVIRELNYSNKEWTTLTLWFTGGMILWQALCTEISCRIGRRMTILTAMTISSFIFAILYYLNDLRVLGLLLFFLGFMPAVFNTVWLPMVAETGKHRPGRTLGLTQFIGNVSATLTLMAVGRSVHGNDFRKTFIVCSAVCCLCTLLFCILTVFLKEKKYGHFVSLPRIRKENLVALGKGPFLWVILLGVCMEPFNFHTANQLFPNLARDIHGIGEQSISVIVALVRLPALLSLFIIAHHIDRLNPSRWYGIGITWAAAGIVSMGLAANSMQVVAAYILFYMGHGIVWGTNAASVNACVENKLRDSAFAIMSISMTLGIFAVGSFHRWLIGEGMAVSSVFAICGLIAVAGGIALITRSRTL